MNERVKALYDQSLIREHGTDYEGNPILKITIDQQKFAELIVKECLNIVMLTHNEGNADNFSYDDALDHVFSNMKEHFGVEE
jgi:hypothetical protein